MFRIDNAKMLNYVNANKRILCISASTHIRINAYTDNLTGGYIDGILD